MDLNLKNLVKIFSKRELIYIYLKARLWKPGYPDVVSKMAVFAWLVSTTIHDVDNCTMDLLPKSKEVSIFPDHEINFVN